MLTSITTQLRQRAWTFQNMLDAHIHTDDVKSLRAALAHAVSLFEMFEGPLDAQADKGQPEARNLKRALELVGAR